MSTTQIAGYIIVREPWHTEPLVRLDGIYYSGIYRNPWKYFSDSYYNDESNRAAELYEKIKNFEFNRQDPTGINIVRQIDQALKMFRFCNRKEEAKNQLIVLSSKKLAQIKGGGIDRNKADIFWLGYDPIRSWSLLKKMMSKKNPRIN